MGYRTPLFAEHERLGARIVPFGGWDMPMHYGSQIEEHLALRTGAGMFDVSHMRILAVTGAGARDFLRHLLANDVARLKEPGHALYSCMLNEQGGVLDDLIVYSLSPGSYRLVVNAGTAEKDQAWMQTQAEGRDLTIRPRTDLAMIAVQGPEARRLVAPHLPLPLREPALALRTFFSVADQEQDWFVARTGYTGEDGFEIMLPADQASGLWRSLLGDGVVPCGLGARDTLRLEAGLNLYGQDMDEDTHPLETGLGWTLAWEPAERDFIGRRALDSLRAAGGLRRWVGLLLTGRGVLRAHQRVLADGQEAGIITSGGYGPSLQRSIALARLNPGISLGQGDLCEVDIRGKATAARLILPPFVRQGTIRIDLD
jgi:aminomethyltransferase